MKADPVTLTTLLDLQATDQVIAQLAHKRRTLPELAQIAELQMRLKDIDGQRVATATRVADLERERKKADGEVELVRTRQDRDEQRLNSGAVTNPKDLESLQHELVALKRRIGVLEDAELEIMEQLEAAQSELDELEAAVADEKAQIAALETARDEAFAEIDRQIVDHEADRKDTIVLIPDDLLALYEKLRSQYGGLAAAELKARRCEGCRLELNSADLRELAKEAPDTVTRCPECSRILVRTATSGL